MTIMLTLSIKYREVVDLKHKAYYTVTKMKERA